MNLNSFELFIQKLYIFEKEFAYFAEAFNSNSHILKNAYSDIPHMFISIFHVFLVLPFSLFACFAQL